MLAHGEACLATANNERIYFFNWHIPVHFWLSNRSSPLVSSLDRMQGQDHRKPASSKIVLLELLDRNS